MKTRRIRQSSARMKFSFISLYAGLVGLFVLFVGLFLLVIVLQDKPLQRSQAAPTAELLTDRNNLTFTGNNYTSKYHLYAAGLDWNKPVGMLVYGDGSGESGINNPTGTWLMGGTNGLIAVAKKNNMVLLTPFSPNTACACWYEGDGAGYAKWLEALVTSIQSQYGIDKKRMAFGGYSSGATLSTRYWVPSGAAERTMEDGVIVAISEGGTPSVQEVAYNANFKTNIHMNWNIGDGDEALNDVKEGQAHYTQAGFQTSIDILPGVTHDREGFGAIIDAQIAKHVPPATGAVISSGPMGPSPAYCGGSTNCVPSGTPSTNMPMITSSPSTTLTPIVSTAPIEEDGNDNEDITNPIVTPGQNYEENNGENGNNLDSGGIMGFIKALLELILRFLESVFN